MPETYNFSQPQDLHIRLPQWLEEYTGEHRRLPTAAARMAFVVGAAKRNISEGTGGPFAAAVFESDSGRLVSLGVNLVTSGNLSILHAEMVALSLAQRKLNNYDLGSPGLPAHELVTSTEPCAMCLGAVPWSGVTRVVTGARDADARHVGFDEGPKTDDWQEALRLRGISVATDVCRAEAVAVLEGYVASGGHIYNSRQNHQP